MPSATYPSPQRFSEAAAFGFRLFPVVHRGKRPAVRWTEFQDRSPIDEELTAWDNSDFNVGIVTGAASGIVVVDVDSPEAQRVVDELELPLTPSVSTARGRHLYYRSPKRLIGNRVNVLGVKLDIRGQGGFVVGPGSIHPDGSIYAWEESPAEVALADFPEQLLALLDEARGQQARSVGPIADAGGPTSGPLAGLDRFLGVEIDAAVKDLDAVPEGGRNNTLFKVTARMARHVSAAGASWADYAKPLDAAARAIGLGAGEIAATLNSGWEAGSKEPTPWIVIAREYVYLSAQECFYHVPSGTELKPNGFNGQYGDLHRERGAFSGFLLANGYISKVHDLTFEPRVADRIVRRDGIEYLNTFRTSIITAIDGDAQPFVDFLTGLIPDTAERDHLLKMMAFTIRNPGLKIRHALLLRSAVQGVGKSILGEIWSELIGPHNARQTTPKEISSDYQGFLRGTLLVICEELNLGMGHRAYNDIKDMITNDKVVINEKYMKQRQWPIYATFVLFSNLETPIMIEPGDRRIFYIDTPATKREPEYYSGFSKWWRANLGIIRGCLDRVDLEQFSPHAPPPMTAAKLKLIAGSKSELAQDLGHAIAERHGCFERDLVTIEAVEWHLGRKHSVRRISTALKELGAVSLGQQRVGGAERASLWIIRNHHYWLYADVETRALELQTVGGGLFSELDGCCLELAHMKLWPREGDPQCSIVGTAAI